VTVVFGIPGEETADLNMALHRSSVQFVLTRHEQGAAFMADVYGRLTGEAGVCLSTLGPGATNLVTGVANANLDRSPVVVITGQADQHRQHKESHQAINVVRMFRPITKWATAIVHPDNIPEVVRKAFKLATLPKPGACHIELSEDVAREEAHGGPIPRQDFLYPAPDCKVVDDAAALIRAARRPAILAGNGVVRSGAVPALRRLASSTGIGVISTFMAKGCVPRTSPQCLFTIGLQAKDLVACAIDAADVVITIGYDLVEYPPRLWNSRNNSRIVHIDSYPAEVDDHYTVAVEVVGHIPHAIWMLENCLVRLGELPNFDMHQQQEVRRQMLEDFAEHKDDRTEGLLRPQKILWDVREVMGEHDILISDVGAHKMWIARYYHCEEPNTCLIPNGFCAMGFALPGAIAAKMVHPERRVLAICGDGGFLMNVQEMETARRLDSDIVVMVWVDNEYGLIGWKQRAEFGEQIDLKFGNPDWLELAHAFGWQGLVVERSEELADILKRAFAHKGPSLVAVPVDYRENLLLSQRLGNMVCPT
jgi:acetolactate synthase-1/2/3 large subunit